MLKYNRLVYLLFLSLLLHGLLMAVGRYRPHTDFLTVESSSYQMIMRLGEELTSKLEKKKQLPVRKGIKSNRKKQMKESTGPSLASAELGQKRTNKLRDYTLELKSFVEKNKVYPRVAMRLRQSGKVRVKLKITADGTFKDIQIISPAVFDSLNLETLNFLKKLGRFKPLPKEFLPTEEFIIPIIYQLAGRY